MAIQFTDWVNGPTTEINTVLPIVSFVLTPSPIVEGRFGGRVARFQWTVTNKQPDECLFKFKVDTPLVTPSWPTEWRADSSYSIDDIPNGEYTFLVKALDKYGNESEIAFYQFIVYRDLSIPRPIAPALDAILPVTSTTFVCSVPQGEIGQRYHFEFQIAKDASMTQFVDDMPWFSSVNGYTGFSYVAPVPQSQGGTVSFTKSLAARRKYWWRCRIRLAGTDQVGAPSEILSFTVGTLATQITLETLPINVRADGSSLAILSAKATNRLGIVDPDWVGVVNLIINSGVATFSGIPDSVPFSAGVATISIYSHTINVVTVSAQANLLADATTTINFVANRLPLAPEWLPSPINQSELYTTSASFSFTIPNDLDNDNLHMKIEIDTTRSFDSPDLVVAETRFSVVGWEYYNGTNWRPYPMNGVPQGLSGGIVRYTTTEPLLDGKTYYCRAAAWDGVER